ncbi:MAG: MFS transporter [Planctomyces sp.]|nr:MFS transporter [Planctomyces sp.]
MAFTLPKPRTALMCGLLMCASLINYMDRQALANLSPDIVKDLQLTKQDYGRVEEAFGIAFAAGSLFFGFAADAVSVRWLYPAVLLAWSAVGVLTGFSQGLNDLLFYRMLLGFFEAGHWPCAMQTTRRVLAAEDRAFGNSVLQSGTSFGAILTPLVILAMHRFYPDNWRRPFIVLGAIGLFWVIGWLATVRASDVAPSEEETGSREGFWSSFFKLFLDARFWVLLAVVIAINTMWQFFRAWLPLFMVDGRGYSTKQQLGFNSAFYIATDVGCIGAGLATKWLHWKGWSVFGSRRLTFTGCALLCALSLLLPLLAKGPLLLMTWLVMGMGALGLFPCYYSFTQDLSVRHPAKVFGLLSCMAWIVTSKLQKPFGAWVDRLQQAGDPAAYDYGLAIAGVLPLIASIGLWIAWPRAATSDSTSDEPAASDDALAS